MAPSKARILCTEDDADTRELLIYVLEHHGYDVTGTESTDEALELARTQHFDLYILDNWMADTSGLELTKKLRAFDIKTPILFYSGAAYDSDKENALEAGAQGYLVKPADEGDLIAEVVRLISQNRRSSALTSKPEQPSTSRNSGAHVFREHSD